MVLNIACPRNSRWGIYDVLGRGGMAELMIIRRYLLYVQVGLDTVPVRLQNSVSRVMNRSLPRLKRVYAQQLLSNAAGQVLCFGTA